MGSPNDLDQSTPHPNLGLLATIYIVIGVPQWSRFRLGVLHKLVTWHRWLCHKSLYFLLCKMGRGEDLLGLQVQNLAHGRTSRSQQMWEPQEVTGEGGWEVALRWIEAGGAGMKAQADPWPWR